MNVVAKYIYRKSISRNELLLWEDILHSRKLVNQ